MSLFEGFCGSAFVWAIMIPVFVVLAYLFWKESKKGSQ